MQLDFSIDVNGYGFVVEVEADGADRYRPTKVSVLANNPLLAASLFSVDVADLREEHPLIYEAINSKMKQEVLRHYPFKMLA